MIYRSNIECPDLTPYFRFRDPPMTRMGHDIPSDPEVDPDCGFLTHDEASILYNIAEAWPGIWVDIGCRFGWSTAHIAAAGNRVVGVDPLLSDPAMMQRAVADIGPMSFVGQTSEEFFSQPRDEIVGAHIDGCHDWPEPLRDAERAIAAGARVIVWHDFLGEPVQRAVMEIALGNEHWAWQEFWTPNGMAVAWDTRWCQSDLILSHDRDVSVNWEPHEIAVDRHEKSIANEIMARRGKHE